MELVVQTRAWFVGLIVASFGGVAFASGSAGPPPPKVDFSKLEASAAVRPPGQEDKQHPVIARLLSEAAPAKAGAPFKLGVHLQQDPEWHTYWKTPGDIGLATKITWKLPDGATAGPQVFPVPVRYDAEGMVSWGYDNEVLHTSLITLPAGLPAGPVTIEADVEWLVCKTSCIPGSAHLATTLQVAAESKPSAWAPLFAHYAKAAPQERVDALELKGALDATPVPADSPFKAVFRIAGAGGHKLGPVGDKPWPTFTVIAGNDWMAMGPPQIKPQPDGGVLVVVEGMTLTPDPLPKSDAVGGLIQVPVDGAMVATEFTIPLPWAAKGAARVAGTDPILAAAGVTYTPAAAAPTPPAPPSPSVAAPTPPPAPPAPAAAVVPAAAPIDTSPVVLLMNVLLALLGGLILNVMPCVLPVLMLKLYGLVEQGGISDADKRQAGLAYTAGILVSFWALAIGVVVARSVLGGSVGWGFQFQYPGYVAALATLVYVFGLSLFGVFEIPAFGVQSADQLSGREGVAGYFFTGVFATLVATPCSAPLLGTAIAFAFQAPTALLFVIFSAIGLGLASPFLFVAFVPAAYRLLPQPGAWMDGFKQVLGFTLMATTLWLYDVLAAQIGIDRGVQFLGFLLFVGLGAWLFGRLGGVAEGLGRQVRGLAVGVAVAAAGGWWLLDLTPAEAADCDDGKTVAANLDFSEHIPWQPFHEERVAALAGKTVFIDFTADWCVSCKVNEKTVLESAAVRERMSKLGVVPLKADWTNKNEMIAAWLKRYGRAGVPMYLVIPPSGAADTILLPEVITPDMVTQALEDAGRKG
jgi:thiol:disulfide interchange protein DsbD